MKSAYELAMERLQKASPSLSLTEEQKKELAEIDSKYRAKIAEKELFLRDQIRKAQTEGKVDDIDSLEKQLASDVRRLQEECEAKKEKLRASFAKVAAFCRRAPHVMSSASALRTARRLTTITPASDVAFSCCRSRARRVSANQDRESRACARA